MTLGNREAQNVAQDTGAVVGDHPAERKHLAGENRFRTHDPAERLEPAGMLRPGSALHNEPVEVPPREPDSDAYPCLGGVVEL